LDDPCLPGPLFHVYIQPTMLTSSAQMEIDLQIEGSASALSLIRSYRISLTAASSSLDSAIASTRRMVLGRMTTAQRQTIHEKLEALYADLGNLRYKAAVLEENMKRLMEMGCFLEVSAGGWLESGCHEGLVGIKSIMVECEERWEEFSKRCERNGVLEVWYWTAIPTHSVNRFGPSTGTLATVGAYIMQQSSSNHQPSKSKLLLARLGCVFPPNPRIHCN
jgi:hypothetical protein